MNYANMSDVLREGEVGNFKLEKFSIEPGNFRASISGIPPGGYIRLRNTAGFGDVIMSDTPMERRTNMWFVRHAHGDVLIGGLGIGLVLFPILDEECVESVTVVEKNQEVIDLVAHQLPSDSRLKIVHADIFEYQPDQKFDCIYFDIWNYVNSDVWQEMKKLKLRYRKWRKPKADSPDGFTRCWAEEHAKNDWPLR